MILIKYFILKNNGIYLNKIIKRLYALMYVKIFIKSQTENQIMILNYYLKYQVNKVKNLIFRIFMMNFKNVIRKSRVNLVLRIKNIQPLLFIMIKMIKMIKNFAF